MKTISILPLLLFLGITIQVFAQTDCNVPTAFKQLDINNVRANYSNNGSDWMNHSTYKGYEVPIGNGTYSIFGGGLWVAGINNDGDLKGNFQVFLQNEQDWSLRAGPMNNNGAGNFVTTDCAAFDKIYKLNRSDVVLHRLYFEMMAENGGVPPSTTPFENGYTIPDVIMNWPTVAEVLPGQPQELAPFFDDDCCGGTPGVYEPELGDYPAFRFPDNEADFDCEKHLLGDQILWWVVNNTANGLPGMQEADYYPKPTGLEIHNMAYAYITDDHINNTTFLRRTLINRSGWEYEDMYFGQFIDVDLGGGQDDYFGSDVERGMAYYYNGDIYDENYEGAIGYGTSPPAIGFDYVGGPLADENDGIDNNWNGVIDEPGERHRMDYAVYYNNSFNPINGHPSTSQHHYYYLQGVWKNGATLTYGGDGTSDAPEAIPCQIMFPGDSDPMLINTGGIPVDPWTEITEAMPTGDRRNVMSSGPFSLAQNEQKVYTLAIPWAREEGCEEVPCSLEALREADDMAQDLHDNCYEMPCMILDAQFDVEIENGQAFLSSPITSGIEYHWTFGNGESMTTEFPFATHQYSEAGNFNICLEIDFGCGTSSSCQAIGGLLCDMITGPELTQIEGTGNTHHFFELTDETIENILANDSSMVIHPTYKKGKGPVKVLVYDLDAIVEADYTLMFDGTGSEAKWKMFIQGTTDTVHSELSIGTPNTQFIEQWGLMVSVDAHLSAESSEPIGSKLIFEDEDTQWLSHIEDTDDFTYQNWIREGTTSIGCIGPGGSDDCWYTDSTQTTIQPCFFNDRPLSTPNESFEKLIDGGWAPSHYVPSLPCHPRLNGGLPSFNGPATYNDPGRIRNVDLVFTADKSLWTRCPVLDLNYAEDADSKVRLRDALSVDKNGLNQNHPDCNVAEATLNGLQVDGAGMSYGMGWFPGYAIDVNTGKRLNIVFGENQKLEADNGNDMIWNPTSTISEDGEFANFGGMHSITILSNHETEPDMASYDYGTSVIEYIQTPIPPFYRNFQRQQQWTGLPILNQGFELLSIEEGLIPTETTIQLRLRHRYQNYLPGETNINNGNPLYNFTIDYEDLISSTEDIVESQNILLYPNPANDQLNVELSGFGNGNVPLELYDMGGKLVVRQIVAASGMSTIDTTPLNSGIYILRVQNSDGVPQFKRLVIAR